MHTEAHEAARKAERFCRFMQRLDTRLHAYLKGFQYADAVYEGASISFLRVRIEFGQSPEEERIQVNERVEGWLIRQGFTIGGKSADELHTIFSVSCEESMITYVLD